MNQVEKDYIIASYNGKNIKDIAKELGYSYQKVYGIISRHGKIVKWSAPMPIDDYESRVIKKLYPYLRTEVLAKILGREKTWIWSRANELDVKKTDMDRVQLSKILQTVQ